MKTKILRLMIVLATSLGVIVPSRAQIEGYWKGNLKMGVNTLALCMNVTTNDGAMNVTLDSPDQGVYDIPAENVCFVHDTLSWEVQSIAASFKGCLQGDTLRGGFTQMGLTLSLNLIKVPKETKAVRPQDPREPFPYTIVELSFVNERDQIALAGTLTLPEGEGPFPAVVLVSGSGAQNRDEELMNHRPFWVLADHLTRSGVAVLRYDDRGVGASEGDAAAATTLDLSYDAEAAFDFLRRHSAVDASKVGILGHSEGGLINFMVAARRPEVGFIISLAGPAVNGMEVTREQQNAIYTAMGMPEVQVEANRLMTDAMYDVIAWSHNETQASDSLQSLLLSYGMNDSLAQRTAEPLLNPWMYYFLKYEPASAIAATQCPCLLLNGTKDLQVVAKQSFDAYQALIERYGKQNMTLREMPGLNHLFQHCDKGTPDEYAKIDETIAPEVLEAIVGFVKGI